MCYAECAYMVTDYIAMRKPCVSVSRNKCQNSYIKHLQLSEP